MPDIVRLSVHSKVFDSMLLHLKYAHCLKILTLDFKLAHIHIILTMAV